MLRVHHALALSATILAACGKSAPADTTPPAAPLLAATLPASPSSNAAPHLTGTAEPLATVKIFGSAACAGAPLATGIATAAGAFDVAVSVTANTTTQLAATATDAAGNVSPCSAAVPYVHDSLPPASPAVATAPASPSSNASPHVTGTAEAGSTVSVYASAACAGAPLASGVASAAGAFDVAVSVTPNVTTQLAATATDAAGNVSGCSTPVTYVHDDRPQTAPAVATAPASPSSNAAPHVTGTAEAASTVTIYGSATCAGAPLATGAASAAGAFDLAVTVATNATTQLAATATDAAGNVSPCSAAVAYLHDDRPPAAPALVATRPASPSPSLTPTVDGTAEASALVRLYAGTGCAGPELSQGYADAAGAFHVQVTVASNVTTSLSATAADAAGNVSACSAVLAYTHDDVAPAPPIVAGSTPASPANQNAPTIQVQAEPGASVSLYADALCATTAQGTGTADASGQVSIGVAVADNTTTTFHAQATDAAGNVSGCSATSVTYVEESRTFTVSPASVELDPGTSPLSSQAFTYALTGGPDAGVTWAVEEAGGGTVDAAGTYQAPVQTGTYHVAATTTGPLPALVARATVVVRSPVIRGSIAYAGASAGRIYVSVGGNFGGAAIGGTSIAVPGPGTYAYTVRGIVATGAVRVSAWFDAAGMVRLVPAADPYGEVTANLTGSSLSGVDVALTAPAAVAPVAPTLNAVFPADATAVVVFDGARDSNGREIADGYDVSCTTGTPPAAPGPGAVHVPAGADHVALVRGLSNGATYVCSAWADNHGVQSAPAVSAPLTLATPAGFTVSGTITLAGGPVAGPAYVVLLDQTTRQARITRYAAPTFPLAYSVAGVPAGSWVLGLIVDVNDDGVFGPGDLNTLSNGPSGGPFIPVAGDLTAQDATFTRANATASAIVSHSVSGTSEAWDLYLAVASGARQPATATASSGPDVSPPVDLGVAMDGGGGGSYVLTAARSLGAVPPSFGTYLLDVGYVDGSAEQLSASVSAANLLTPAVLISPTGGASAAPQPTFAWAEPIPAPPAPYTYRLSLRQAGGGRVWETDDFAPAAACAGATCQVAYGFDGRASWPSLPPGDYQWELSVRDAAQDQAWTSAGFHVPVDVTVSPTAPALYPGESTLLTATVTGTGSVTWATTCGTVTPRADPKQADYVAPAAGPCAVTATSTEEPTRLATATITVKPVSIAVTPAALTLEAGQVQVLTAAVTGTGSVTWSAGCGTLAPLADPLAVRYTAPAAGPCTVTATSDLQPWQSAAAAVTVTATPQLQLDPVTAVLNPGQTQPFVAKLGGAVQPATFTVVEPSGGVIGADGLYVAPAAAGLYHVVAADGSGRTASAVVQVVSAAASPQAVVTITPPAASVVQQGSLGFSATVQGCPGPGPADLSVSWTLRETGTTGSVNPTSPNAATFQAPWSPGVYHVVARAACDPTKTAVAAVTVDLPTVSGTVSWAGTGTGTGRIFVALVTSWGEVVSGTSLAAPGPFTLRGVQQTGALTLRAWRDTLGVETFQRGLEPFAELPVTVPAGGSLSGVTVPLADVTPPAPPAPSSVNAFPGDGRAVVMVQRVQDASGNPLADGYHLRCDTVPASGTPVLLDGTLADDQAFILKGANGTTWTCDGWATAAGQASPTVTSAPFTLGAPVGGQTVTGTVTVDGPAPAGPLYVVLFDPAGAIFTQRIDAPVFPATFAIAGVPNGAYQLGAILDRDDDGVLSRTDPMSFRGGANPIVTVTGAPVAGADVALGVADAQVIAATSHSTGSWGEAYDLAVEVRSGVRVPRQAAVVGGPGIWPPVDLGIESNGGGGDTDVRLRTRFWLGAVRPVVGATYSIEVTWDDGTVTTLPATVTAVLDPPTPVAPVDPLTPAITAPAVPVFSWAAPAALPATPYTYSVYVYQGASWNLWDLPSTQLSATYGTVQPGAPAANPPTLPAGTYRWVAAIQDASGNYASSEATFTVSP